MRQDFGSCWFRAARSIPCACFAACAYPRQRNCEIHRRRGSFSSRKAYPGRCPKHYEPDARTQSSPFPYPFPYPCPCPCPCQFLQPRSSYQSRRGPGQSPCRTPDETPQPRSQASRSSTLRPRFAHPPSA
ncbi:hypothetical protein BJX64DRAFT_263770 [Aspergillus heterothallicus]